MDCLLIFFFVASLPVLWFLYSKWVYSYWKRKGVIQLQPELVYGDLRDMLTGKSSLGEKYRDLYFLFKRLNVKYGGVYRSLKPRLVLTDIDLVKKVMQQDAGYFDSRGLYSHKADILSQNMFRLDGEKRKKMRAKFTPTFTSSKMKLMFETMIQKEKRLDEVLEEYARNGGDFDAKDLMRRFTTDVITSCFFGIECDSLEDPHSIYREYGDKINIAKPWDLFLQSVFPQHLLGYVGYKTFGNVEDFYQQLVRSTIDYRTKNSISRNDFMQLLLQLRENGTVGDNGKGTKDEYSLTDDEIVAQTFLFFAAGYDTSSMTLTYVAYELANHPEIQRKLKQEIDEILEKYHGHLTYESLKEMVYMDKVVYETLRLYPVLPVLFRNCTKQYTVPGTDFTIDKGTTVVIPVYGFHTDPDYFPNPYKFDPERFNEEEKAKRPDFTYLPFGEGPRVCIGLRFAWMQVKTGLVALLKHYSILKNLKTPESLVFIKGSMMFHSENDIILSVRTH